MIAVVQAVRSRITRSRPQASPTEWTQLVETTCPTWCSNGSTCDSYHFRKLEGVVASGGELNVSAEYGAVLPAAVTWVEQEPDSRDPDPWVGLELVVPISDQFPAVKRLSTYFSASDARALAAQLTKAADLIEGDRR